MARRPRQAVTAIVATFWPALGRPAAAVPLGLAARLLFIKRTFRLRRTSAKEAPRLGQRQDRCDAGDLLSCGTAGATTAALVPRRPGRQAAGRRGRRPHHGARRISLAPNKPALPRAIPNPPDLVRSPSVRPPANPGAFLGIAPSSGQRVALMPQWRQDYPNNRPPTPANAISEMGQEPPNALQKKNWHPLPGAPAIVVISCRSPAN
jgi:hypothetical protein